MSIEMINDLDTLLRDFSMEVTFIPCDLSLPQKDWGLAYKIDVLYKGRHVLTTPYTMGVGHIPGYKLMQRVRSATEINQIKEILTKGMGGFTKSGNYYTHTKIEPSLKDVMYSLVSDSDVLNYRGFEDWAENLGYDTDSRKAERIWQACLESALKLRNGIGQELFDELINAYQDY